MNLKDYLSPAGRKKKTQFAKIHCLGFERFEGEVGGESREGDIKRSERTRRSLLLLQLISSRSP